VWLLANLDENLHGDEIIWRSCQLRHQHKQQQQLVLQHFPTTTSSLQNESDRSCCRISCMLAGFANLTLLVPAAAAVGDDFIDSCVAAFC